MSLIRATFAIYDNNFNPIALFPGDIPAWAAPFMNTHLIQCFPYGSPHSVPLPTLVPFSSSSQMTTTVAEPDSFEEEDDSTDILEIHKVHWCSPQKKVKTEASSFPMPIAPHSMLLQTPPPKITTCPGAPQKPRRRGRPARRLNL